MVVLASLVVTPENEAVRQFLRENRVLGEEALRRRIERGIAEGDVPADADERVLAAFYTAVNQGLSVQARDGTSVAAMEAIVDAAMAAWDRLVESKAE
jgi:hypothetical protein